VKLAQQTTQYSRLTDQRIFISSTTAPAMNHHHSINQQITVSRKQSYFRVKQFLKTSDQISW